MAAVTFEPRFDWALCPEPRRAFEPVQLVPPEEESFRWVRMGRRADACGPYRMAASFGWVARSPVDVTLRPFEELFFQCGADELDATVQNFGLAEVWERSGFYVGLREKLGLRAYDFRVDDHWEVMFMPNGEGTLEWRLGFNVMLPKGYVLLIQDAGQPGFRIVSGILSNALVERANRFVGHSIAIRPERAVKLRRGDPVAHFVALDQATLRTNSSR